MGKKVTYEEAKERFKHRDDIKLIREGYNGWSKVSLFYDFEEQDYFSSIPYYIFTNNVGHPKRSYKAISKTKSLSLKDALERFQHRDDIELVQNSYISWEKKATFYDKKVEKCWEAFPKKVLKHNSFHPERKDLWKKERICIFCNKSYIPTYGIQKYCSRRCSMLVRGEEKTKKQTFETNCGWCKTTFTKRVSQKSKIGDFCSKKCFYSFSRGYEEKYII